MGVGSSPPYRLRPNKAVDRELFLGLLTRSAASLRLEKYEYIGLGGPFLEDFRLVHARLGIEHMTSVESEEAVHKRQLFNRPVDCIDCVHTTLEDYIDEREFEKSVIIWFDYTEPKKITTQIERFARAVGEVPIGSILRVTLNASPSSLGNPDKDEIAVEVGDLSANHESKPTIHEWRLDRFRERLGTLFPVDLKPEGMKHKGFGKSVLHALRLAVEKEALSCRDREIVWALATHYADGQPMVTAALLVTAVGDSTVGELVKGWEFYSTPQDPHLLDMPALSTLERLKMESTSDPETCLGFDLPGSDMGENPFSTFRKFYRIYPHFSRVAL